MKSRNQYLFIFILICAFGCKSEIEFVSYNSPAIKYMGRIGISDSLKAKELYWSGTSIKMNFEGTGLKAVFSDERGDNFYNIIIDEDSMYTLKLDSLKREYLLCDLKYGKHTLEIFKRTEWDRGTSYFYGFHLNDGTKVIEANEQGKRKIEFYGNSITAGYGVIDYSGKDRPDSIYTDHYSTYAAILARHYGAEFHSICKSGIGIMISWFPVIMPEIYDRIDPNDKNSKWDFSLFTPDIVVVNLFQNDSWLVNLPDHPSFKQRFGDEKPDEDFIINSYKNFISKLREKYPKTTIICILGNMDITKEGSKWPQYVSDAVKELKDDKIFTHFIPYKNSPGHPKEAEQKTMAESLIKFIDENIDW